MTIFGNGVFIDDQVKMTCVLIKRGNLDPETDTRGQCQVKMETEIGVMHLQAKAQRGMLAASRS